MFSALLSFIGGNAFRTLVGEISAHITAKREHKFEVERMKLQADIDAAASARQLEGIKVQAEMGVKTIQVQGSADVARIEASAWEAAVGATTRTMGIVFIDAWNAGIRPGVATWAVVMLTLESGKYVVLSEFMVSVCSAALGIFLADRNLAKRGR